MFDVGVDGSHEVEANDVEGSRVAEASLVDSAEGDISSSSRNSKAEGPAGLSNLLSTLVNAFPELVLTARFFLASVVLVLALVLEALVQLLRLGEDDGEEEHKGDDDLHSYFMIIDY